MAEACPDAHPTRFSQAPRKDARMVDHLRQPWIEPAGPCEEPADLVGLEAKPSAQQIEDELRGTTGVHLTREAPQAHSARPGGDRPQPSGQFLFRPVWTKQA